MAVVWIPLRRTRLGLSIYAIGSNQLAAFRSGVSVGRTKIVAYAFTGLFAALGGLSLTASTGIGNPVPGPYTLLSVAAVVLGGVSLAGGRGGVVGPIIGVLILVLIQNDLAFMSLDPNLSAGDPGPHPHRRGHVRQPDPVAAGQTMTAATQAVGRGTAGGWRRLLREQPIIPLSFILLVLVIAYAIARPGVVNADWAGVIIRAAVPLAILAGCQTLTMLTGGIDLSVGAVASMAGFVVATLVNGPGLWVGLAVALTAALLAGLLTGIGVGIFRVHPLIMSLGVSFVVLGLANAWQILTVTSSTGVVAGVPHHRVRPLRPDPAL